MRKVFVTADNILSPLGFTTKENFSRLVKSTSGIRQHTDQNFSEVPYYASLIGNFDGSVENSGQYHYTKFEQLLIASIREAMKNSDFDPQDKKNVLIISSTKGNISLLESDNDPSIDSKRISLNHSAKKVAEYFQFVNEPLVVSNACISGLLAMIMGMRLIQSGQFEQAVVAGADVVSKFVLSGFQSFQAISEEPCKPFDEARNGINLGEAAGTVILSAKSENSKGIRIAGGSVSNDANHISGPSRTGEELFQAISKALKEAGLSASDIDLISAHGTATVYNDEMEAKAIDLAGMQSVPVNSLKGNYGHTLGAAGLIESIASIHSLMENTVLPTLGFQHLGVSKPLNVSNTIRRMPLRNCLKTASGFGGCNAAVVICKE